jgi:hypothetical protein
MSKKTMEQPNARRTEENCNPLNLNLPDYAKSDEAGNSK